MSHATLAGPIYPSTVFSSERFQRGMRTGREIAATAIQSITLAGFLWLILAGPGFLQDLASIVPLR